MSKATILQQPFRTYNGGKSGNGTFQNIISQVSKCNIFIDAMAGNGGIASHISNAGIIVINDIDTGIVSKWKDLIDKNNTGHPGKIILENLDYWDLIVKYDIARSETVFFYFDPPYLLSTRKSKKPLYKYEWSEADHKQFLSLAPTVKSNCMISAYENDLYNKMLKGWNKYFFKSQTRNGQRIECLYMNYEQSNILQDFSHVGKDYLDRQRLKRKISRWLNKLKQLPPLERTMIINSIINEYKKDSIDLLQ